jgi:saccharolysin
MNVNPDKEVRDASSKGQEELEKFHLESVTREDVFKKIKAVYESELDKLDPEDRRLTDKLYKRFLRNGLGLDKEKRHKVVELRKKLTDLSLQFQKQLGEDKEYLLFTREELEGVPEATLENFEKEGDKYKVTYKYPDYIPTMKYAKDANTRKRLFDGYENRVAENRPLVKQAVKIRAEVAKLMGYSSHSAYVLEDRMAKSPETVKSFLEDLLSKTTTKGRQELQRMLNLKNEDLKSRGLPEEDKFYIWDNSYYNNLLLEREYKVDSEKISEYFPLDQTIAGMFDIFSRLFQLKFIPVDTKDKKELTWHEDVKLYEVHEDDKFRGYLYLDMHPRDNKYGHAANFSLLNGYQDGDGTTTYPVTALVCNFSKPTSAKPSLLKHNEVTTFFHELGHGIHDLVGRSRYALFSGTSVDWDFVEAPSQMLEFWTWNEEQLRQMSGHYTDAAKKLDDDLISSLVRSKHVNQALFILRQLHFGIFDFTIHNDPNGESDLDELWNEKRVEICGYHHDKPNYGYSSFGHIMGGYDSGYYGYLWSEVFATDMYYSKFKSDPLNSKVGVEYRDKVIGRAGSRDQLESLREFLGRDPNNTAFLEELGITH